MKKKIKILCVVSAIFVFNTICAFGNSEVIVIKVGEKRMSPAFSFMKNDKTYTSVRDLCNQLNIPVAWDGNTREVFLDIYNRKIPISEQTEYKEEGVLPDEKTALVVGKAILERYAGQNMEYETDRAVYYLRVEFLREKNAWRIIQNFKLKDGFIGSVDGGSYANVELNKNTGEVMYINTYSTFAD